MGLTLCPGQGSCVMMKAKLEGKLFFSPLISKHSRQILVQSAKPSLVFHLLNNGKHKSRAFVKMQPWPTCLSSVLGYFNSEDCMTLWVNDLPTTCQKKRGIETRKEAVCLVFHPVFFLWYQAWEGKGKGSLEWHTYTRTLSQRCWPKHISSFSRSALLWSQVWTEGGMSCNSFTYRLQKTHIPAVVNGVTQRTSFPKFPFIVIIFTPDLTGIFFFFFYSTETSDSPQKVDETEMYTE